MSLLLSVTAAAAAAASFAAVDQKVAAAKEVIRQLHWHFIVSWVRMLLEYLCLCKFRG